MKASLSYETISIVSPRSTSKLPASSSTPAIGIAARPQAAHPEVPGRIAGADTGRVPAYREAVAPSEQGLHRVAAALVELERAPDCLFVLPLIDEGRAAPRLDEPIARFGDGRLQIEEPVPSPGPTGQHWRHRGEEGRDNRGGDIGHG